MDRPEHPPAGRFPCPVPLRSIAPNSPTISWPRRKIWSAGGRSPTNSDNGPSWSACCTNNLSWPTAKPPGGRNCIPTPSADGGSDGRPETSPCGTDRAGAAGPLFPPLDRALVQAIACETVFETRRPLSRQSLGDLTRRACDALQGPVSRSTVWRILDASALKPWRYEHWIFPRDPQFAQKAGVVLDLYAGLWQGQPLTARDCLLSADEKTSIQARIRCHPTVGPAPGRPRRVEHEYERGGALQYLAAWDVRRGRVLGRCEARTGIAPFGRLVAQVMRQRPYGAADRVFWVVDNGTSHRGERSVRRLSEAFANAILVHTPTHASWLNQVEIYFSLIQRKVRTPNDFTGLEQVEQRLRLYEELTNREPRPFNWKFDRAALQELLRRIEAKQGR